MRLPFAIALIVWLPVACAAQGGDEAANARFLDLRAQWQVAQAIPPGDPARAEAMRAVAAAVERLVAEAPLATVPMLLSLGETVAGMSLEAMRAELALLPDEDGGCLSDGCLGGRLEAVLDELQRSEDVEDAAAAAARMLARAGSAERALQLVDRVGSGRGRERILVMVTAGLYDAGKVAEADRLVESLGDPRLRLQAKQRAVMAALVQGKAARVEHLLALMPPDDVFAMQARLGLIDLLARRGHVAAAERIAAGAAEPGLRQAGESALMAHAILVGLGGDPRTGAEAARRALLALPNSRGRAIGLIGLAVALARAGDAEAAADIAALPDLAKDHWGVVSLALTLAQDGPVPAPVLAALPPPGSGEAMMVALLTEGTGPLLARLRTGPADPFTVFDLSRVAQRVDFDGQTELARHLAAAAMEMALSVEHPAQRSAAVGKVARQMYFMGRTP